MRPRLTFYLFIAALVVLDAVLLRSPNLLGKIGLLIYKYHYLRTFPKALLTVSLVVGVAILIAEAIRFLVKKESLKRTVGRVILFLLAAVAVAILVKTGLDFTAWSYSHTGLRFRIGAYLLPTILVIVFFYAWITVPKVEEA
ncbi:MAG TPA: hypothetical protein VGK59_16255, partial [Ohtaekwangia sp.]